MTEPTCIAVLPGTTESCGKHAPCIVRFSDERAPMCEDCALRLQQQWQAAGAHLPVDRLPLFESAPLLGTKLPKTLRPYQERTIRMLRLHVQNGKKLVAPTSSSRVKVNKK